MSIVCGSPWAICTLPLAIACWIIGPSCVSAARPSTPPMSLRGRSGCPPPTCWPTTGWPSALANEPSAARRPTRGSRSRACGGGRRSPRRRSYRRDRSRKPQTSSTEKVSQLAGSPDSIAGVEPAPALLGGAVGEAVGVDALPRLALEPVVADRLGGVERLLDVALLEVARLEHGRRPDARVAVGLQLGADRELVGTVGVVAAEAVDLGVGAAQVLDVVADLVRDHVGPGEVAGGVELACACPRRSSGRGRRAGRRGSRTAPRPRSPSRSRRCGPRSRTGTSCAGS